MEPTDANGRGPSEPLVHSTSRKPQEKPRKSILPCRLAERPRNFEIYAKTSTPFGAEIRAAVARALAHEDLFINDLRA
jgi:hypothetical protein